MHVSDNELTIISFVFESFLFQFRSFIDFFMLYVCLLLKTDHKGKISKEKFYKSLKRKFEKDHHSKALYVDDYFRTHVFGQNEFNGLSQNNWGALLIDLRDKIAHRDKIRPSFKSNEKLMDRILFNWPTIQDLTYDRFYQSIENGMFSLFSDVITHIYNLKWISGKVNYNSWD